MFWKHSESVVVTLRFGGTSSLGLAKRATKAGEPQNLAGNTSGTLLLPSADAELRCCQDTSW